MFLHSRFVMAQISVQENVLGGDIGFHAFEIFCIIKQLLLPTVVCLSGWHLNLSILTNLHMLAFLYNMPTENCQMHSSSHITKSRGAVICLL